MLSGQKARFRLQPFTDNPCALLAVVRPRLREAELAISEYYSSR
jgi:hypothetical protein